MMRLRAVCFSVLTVLGLALVARAAPADLRCQGLVEPAGIDLPMPRLSWILLADQPTERNIRQTAYQILASSTLDRLTENTGDLWDSSRVEGSDSLNIAYQGKPLASGQRVFWKVKVWTTSNQSGSWSPVSAWTMGIMSPHDWEPARWIGLNATTGGSAIGYHAEPTPDAKESKWVQVDLGASRHIDAVRVIPHGSRGHCGICLSHPLQG